MPDMENFKTLPVGSLGLIALPGCEALMQKVNNYLVKWRKERGSQFVKAPILGVYDKDSFMIDVKIPRFGSGEAKGVVEESVRGEDVYIMVDVCNYNIKYRMFQKENPMSPDDHFQNLKRAVAAVGKKARRITVIMPFLYESRQYRRRGRESLDCAMFLQELINMGVHHILTFDAHDPRIQNAIPLQNFDNVMPTYQFIKSLLTDHTDIKLDSDHMMIISPDEGAMGRAVYFANVLGLDAGMFYKRRDYTKLEGGRHPVVTHEFLGSDVVGKDVVIIDDMISSGESVLEVAKELKKRNAGRVFICGTFGLFTGGLELFDEYYEKGLIDALYTTNLVYQTTELLAKPYYHNVDMCKYIALLIDSCNHDASIQALLDPITRIHTITDEYRNRAGRFQTN